MKTITLSLPSNEFSYNIKVGENIFGDMAEEIRKVTRGKKIAVVTDSNVAPLYLSSLKSMLTSAGFAFCSYVFLAGEASKNYHTILEIYNFLAESEITRSDLIIALGGGVTGDMTGFAAATFLRGVPFVQIPTTVLAAVDSSVGGKTGFDTKYQKNQIGAFYQPSLVLIDPLLFETLPESVFYDGFAEIIKHGFIANPQILSLLQGDWRENLTEIIYESVKVKVNIVMQDERDTGIRGILNFGHTFGHAAEKLENFEGITHGKAVGAGMVYAAKLGEYLGETPSGTADRIKEINLKFNLPIIFNQKSNELFEAALSDKKNLSGKIGIILLSKIGEAFIRPTEVGELREIMQKVEV